MLMETNRYPFPVEVRAWLTSRRPNHGCHRLTSKLSFPSSIILTDLLHFHASNPHTLLLIKQSLTKNSSTRTEGCSRGHPGRHHPAGPAEQQDHGDQGERLQEPERAARKRRFTSMCAAQCLCVIPKVM